MNIAETLLLAVGNEEARFLRQPINLLTSYLESSYFRDQREKKQINLLQKNVNFRDYTFRIPALDYLGHLKILFGEAGMRQEANDIEMFVMKYDGQTCKLS